MLSVLVTFQKISYVFDGLIILSIYAAGKALALALAQNGVFVTVVDISEGRGKEVASLIEKENTKFQPKFKFPSAMFIRCDVTNTSMYPFSFGHYQLSCLFTFINCHVSIG